MKHPFVTEVAALLPVQKLLRLEAPTDSAFLWTLPGDRLDGGAEPAGAVAATVAAVAAAPGSRLNLLLTGPDIAVAAAWDHALSVRAAPVPP